MLDFKFWNKKKILVTGHTGFKGGWLCTILNSLGSNVSGYSLDPVGKNNLFNTINLKKHINFDIRKDICDLEFLKKTIKKVEPEIIFHLAAQPSVIESFKKPYQTVMSNVIGTVNVLEAIRTNQKVKSVILITTDKVYQNYNQNTYFDENSKLGGDDIYSGSKACCEIMANSYLKSFINNFKCNIATVRAGNCFGGGDWTPERITKDLIENLFNNKRLVLRNPEATRPWQHVVEPLIGYLILAQKLNSKRGRFYTGAWNFGPSTKQNLKVRNFVNLFKKNLNLKLANDKKIIKLKKEKVKFFESKNLNINSKKAYIKLNWKPRLSITDSIKLTIDWHKAYLLKENMFEFTKKQINTYLNTKIS